MVKTRVHDLAAEFGVSAEQLMSMLKDMNIFARTHMSALEDGQVSAIRVRWEREKRKAAQADEPAPKKRAKKAAAKPAEPAEPVSEAGKPVRRRRTAAEVAEADAVLEAERVAETLRLEAIELARPIEKREEPMLSPSLEERARTLQGSASCPGGRRGRAGVCAGRRPAQGRGQRRGTGSAGGAASAARPSQHSARSFRQPAYPHPDPASGGRAGK